MELPFSIGHLLVSLSDYVGLGYSAGGVFRQEPIAATCLATQLLTDNSLFGDTVVFVLNFVLFV